MRYTTLLSKIAAISLLSGCVTTSQNQIQNDVSQPDLKDLIHTACDQIKTNTQGEKFQDGDGITKTDYMVDSHSKNISISCVYLEGDLNYILLGQKDGDYVTSGIFDVDVDGNFDSVLLIFEGYPKLVPTKDLDFNLNKHIDNKAYRELREYLEK